MSKAKLSLIDVSQKLSTGHLGDVYSDLFRILAGVDSFAGNRSAIFRNVFWVEKPKKTRPLKCNVLIINSDEEPSGFRNTILILNIICIKNLQFAYFLLVPGAFAKSSSIINNNNIIAKRAQ